MGQTTPPAVDWSCRLYAHLLAILPGHFRQDYNQPILQAFRDLCLAAWRARGPLGLTTVWMQALPDLADGAAGEWQLALTFGGTMERVSVRTSLLMAFVGCAVLMAYLILAHNTPYVTRYVGGLLAIVGILSVLASGWRSRYWQQSAPGGSGSELVESGSSERGSSRTRSLMIGLELALLVLFVYVFRVLFPTALRLAGAQHMVWVRDLLNPAGHNTFLDATILLGAYLAVTVYGTRSGGIRARIWKVGAIAGGVAGLTALLLGLIVPLNTTVMVMFGAAVIAGLIAGLLTGQTEAGTLGGFWCGLTCALVWATGSMAMDLTLASRLAGIAWASTHNFCQGLVGTEFAACSIGSDLHSWGIMLVGLPILSGGLGVIGGLGGAALTKARPPMESQWGRALLTPVVFCGVMVLFVVAKTAGL